MIGLVRIYRDVCVTRAKKLAHGCADGVIFIAKKTTKKVRTLQLAVFSQAANVVNARLDTVQSFHDSLLHVERRKGDLLRQERPLPQANAIG